ncbi:MAG: EAL domain-containing protein [Actinomycetes bacterium]
MAQAEHQSPRQSRSRTAQPLQSQPRTAQPRTAQPGRRPGPRDRSEQRQPAPAQTELPVDRRSLAARSYLFAVSGVGVAAMLLILLGTPRAEIRQLTDLSAFWTILVLVLVGELRPIFTPGRPDPAGITMSTMFSFAALLFFGLPSAVAVQALATVAAGVVHRTEWWRTAFNLGQHTLSLTVSWWLLSLGGVTGLPTGTAPPNGHDLVAVAAAALSYFLLNNGFVWVALALLRREPLLDTVREDAAFQFAVHMTLVGLAPLVAVVMFYRWQLLPLFLLPLLAIRSNAEGTLERERQALRDALTGLGNRQHLVARTDEVLASARSTGATVALFLLDLDRFKEVNDTLGHPVGDRILQLAAERLEGTLRPGDAVARLGGDEFGVLLPDVRDAVAADEIAQRIRAVLEMPFHVGDTEIDLEVSIGIALAPAHGSDSEQLLQRADVAMYVAKSSRSGVETYAAERDLNTPDRLGLLGALRRAVDEGQLELHYQPKIHVEDGTVAGVEALVRWRHPTRGMVLPDEFIPLAEQSGLMQRITDLVLDEALSQVAAWTRSGLRIPVAVNVSMRDLQDPQFADRLGERLADHCVAPGLIILEITERVLMADAAGASATLGALDALGVRISLDDFGTGYSSLVLLKRLPVQEIKVDRSFVKRLGEDTGPDEDATIVRSIIDLGHSLGMTVVAEGVETRASLERLRAFGCDRAQGWHLSPALPAAEVVVWLAERHAAWPVLRVAGH